MNHADDMQLPEEVVASVLAAVPIRPVAAVELSECLDRTVAALSAVGIEAIADRRGIEYVDGVEGIDQPLVALVNAIVERRFPPRIDGTA